MSGMGSITVHVPLAIRPRPGRKTIVRPAGSAPSASIATHADSGHGEGAGPCVPLEADVGRWTLYHIGLAEAAEWEYRDEPLAPLKGFPGVMRARMRQKKRWQLNEMF